MSAADQALFSYGTLQDPAVQREQFGRTLAGQADRLEGWRVGLVRIGDPEVVRQSGLTHHKAIVADPQAPTLDGMVLMITATELAAADEYEAGEYERRMVTLQSGRDAWVYVAAPGLAME